MVLTELDEKSSEYLSYDILDKQFLRIFEPFRVVQKILGSCRVDVRDQFVTAPTALQKLYSVIFVIMTISFTNSILQDYSTIFYYKHEMKNLWTAGICGVLTIFSLNIFQARFFNNDANIQLYIQMQQIDRIMKLDGNKQIYKEHYKRNAIILTALGSVTFFLLMLGLFLIKDDFGFMELFALTWAMVTFILELSCCSSHLIYFTARLKLINSLIANHLKKDISSIMEAICKRYDSKNTSTEKQSFDTSDIHIHLKQLFYGFNSFNDLYQFQMLLFCASFVGWILVTFQYAIFTLKCLQNVIINVDMHLVFLDLLQLVITALVEVIVLLVICMRSELFFREVDKTKKLTISVLSRYTDGPLRAKTKNMLKSIEETPPNFSVYGMWRMDARLLLNMFKITTTFLVILLQFAFL